MFGYKAQMCYDFKSAHSSNECEDDFDVDASFGQASDSPNFLANLRDMADSLVKIMIICGINKYKAKSVLGLTIYALKHYDYGSKNTVQPPKKMLRAGDIYYELGSKFLMSRSEVDTVFSIIKFGFSALYFTPQNKKNPCNFVHEGVFAYAATRTAQEYGRIEGLIVTAEREFERKILKVYRKLYDRMKQRWSEPLKVGCQCCICTKNAAAQAAPKVEKDKCAPDVLPKCCRKRKRPPKPKPKPSCRDSKSPCACGVNPFELQFVTSIWQRPDMQTYYQDTIEERPDDGCDGWHNPIWPTPFAAKIEPAEKSCPDWFDPGYLKKLETIEEEVEEEETNATESGVNIGKPDEGAKVGVAK